VTDYAQPVSDPGVESDYQITLTGFGDIPAAGSAHASLDVHVREARMLIQTEETGNINVKAEDLAYSETSTASGDITLFRKAMGYSSKITARGLWIPPSPA